MPGAVGGSRPLVTHVHAAAHADLDRRLRGVAEGRGFSALVIAEAGMGKSTLLDRAVRGAQDRSPLTVLRCTGHEAEVEAPFSGLTTLLWPVRERLDELDPLVGARLMVAMGLGDGSPVEPSAVAAATLDFLGVLSPVVCVVDDLQCLDLGTRTVVRFVAHRAEPAGAGILLASRVAPDLGDFDVAELRLSPLDASLTRALVEAQGLSIAPAVAEVLTHETGGNPLAILEAVRSLDDAQRAGGAPLGPIDIGSSLLDVYARELRTLDPLARDTMLVVALHREGDVLVVDRALAHLGHPNDGVRPEALDGVLVRARHQIAFCHPLRRQAVVQSMARADRRRVHRALAAALREMGDVDGETVQLAACVDPPDAAIAERLSQAAVSASIRGDLALAASRHEQAAVFCTSLQERGAELLQAGIAAAQGGAPYDHLFVGAIRLSPDGEPRLGALAARALAASWHGDHDVVLELADDARDAPPSWSTAILTGLGGHVAFDRLDLIVSRRHWRHLAEIAEHLDLAEARGPQLLVLHELAVCRALYDGEMPPEEWIEVLLRGSVEDGAIDLAPSVVFMLILLERFDDADGLLRESRRATRRVGAVGAAVWNDLADAYLALATGQVDRAARLAAAAGPVAVAARMPWAIEVVVAVQARVDAIRGDAASARRLATDRRADLRSATVLYALDASIGAAHLAVGDLDVARTVLGRVADGPGDALAHPFHRAVHPDLVECLVLMGEQDAAVRMAARHAEHLQPGIGHLAAALLARIAALTADTTEAADAAFEQSVAHHEASPEEFEHARTLLAFGRHLRSTRRPSAARPRLLDAARRFDQIGADPWAEQARHHARLAGARPDGFDRRDDASSDLDGVTLTAQEWEVSRQVADGRRNREVAAALFVSEKTVEAHLSRTYRKLGVRSRTELARWFNDHPRDAGRLEAPE